MFYELLPRRWRVFLFFREILFFCLAFLGCMGLCGSKNSGKKKTRSMAGLGLIEHVPNSRVSKKRRGYLDFCAENMCSLRSCVVSAWILYGVNFGR